VDVVRSPLQTALLLAGLVAVGVVAGVLGLPQAAVVVFTAGVGGALVVTDANKRRDAGAREAAGSSIDGFPLQVPAERVAVGRSFQFRLLPPSRQVRAPGLLCIRPGEARFVPAKDRHRSRAWAGPVSAAAVEQNRSCAVVRLHGAEGAAQFVVQQPPSDLDDAVAAWLAPPAGGAAAQ